MENKTGWNRLAAEPKGMVYGASEWPGNVS